MYASTSSPSLPSFVTPAIDPRVRNAGIAVLASAGVLVIAALTKSWFTAGDEGGIGLLGLEACRRGGCQSISWFDVPRVPSQIPLLATTALIACVATIAALIHSGVRLLQGAPELVRLRYVVPAIVCAAAGVTGFVASLTFGDAARGLSLGWSTVAGFAGLLATAITVVFFVRPLSEERAGFPR